MRLLMLGIVATGLVACQSDDSPPAEPAAAAETSAATAAAATPAELLADVLAAQPEDVQARYPFRNPGETLSLIHISEPTRQ